MSDIVGALLFRKRVDASPLSTREESCVTEQHATRSYGSFNPLAERERERASNAKLYG